MKLFNKIAIVGTGLIGGSLALAIKDKRLAAEIIGTSRRRENLVLAKKVGAIDRGSVELEIIKDADLVILATPVSAIIELAPEISRIIKKECIVSDVGSTKEEIVSKLERIFPNFVGSHPLAGSEKRSIANSDPAIFKDSLCILTPTKNTYKPALRKIKKLWSEVGAKVILLTPARHDQILSYTSHLPHAIAFSLIDSVPSSHLKFASTGLKDTTRIAASDSELWAQILLSNRKNILRAIKNFDKSLERIKSAIQKKDLRRLSVILETAKEKRLENSI